MSLSDRLYLTVVLSHFVRRMAMAIRTAADFPARMLSLSLSSQRQTKFRVQAEPEMSKTLANNCLTQLCEVNNHQ